MQDRISPVRVAWRSSLLVALSCCFTLLAHHSGAQVRIPAEALETAEAIQQVLDQGVQLERSRRWGEALTHYEDASRAHPGHQEIQRRLSVSRIHFDLGRRYADSSYTHLVRSISQQEAGDIYGDVLLKIHTHYVTVPDWQQLVRRGTRNLEVALHDPIFLERNLPNVSAEQVSEFCGRLNQSIDWRAIQSRQTAWEVVESVGRRASRQLGLSPTAVILEYTCGAAAALDEYSACLTPAQLEDVYSQIEGSFIGLGIELKSHDASLLIVHVLSGSPAERSGIHRGDRIVEVDGRSTSHVSTDQAVDMLKGSEGTTVDLMVVTQENAPRRLRIRRERVDVPSVEDVKMLEVESGVGYARLTTFQKTTDRDMDAALWKLYRQGMKSLIVDVRGNPGGLLTAAVEVADKFLMGGTIVSTRGRSPREDFDYKAHRQGTWRVPLVVLVDRDSASASEIFAAAIHDHDRGTIIGQQSYGKGSVQGIFPLGMSKVGVRLTTARFYAPNGQPISRRGVSPDIVVQVAEKPDSLILDGRRPVADAQDPVVAAGIQAAQKLVAQR